MASLKFKVIDRKDKELCNFEEYSKVIGDNSTMEELMKHIIKKSDYLRKF
jgi:hypothetical protein